jgi:hypothetical protein
MLSFLPLYTAPHCTIFANKLVRSISACRGMYSTPSCSEYSMLGTVRSKEFYKIAPIVPVAP